MSMKLAEALAEASDSELHDLACFLTAKFRVQTLNAETNEASQVEEAGIVTALNDWAALGGGIAAGKE